MKAAKLKYPANYKPREQFSPSGLELLAACGEAWWRRYVLGIKELDVPNWWESRKLPRPVDPGANASAIAKATYRERLKEYNRLTRRSLGQAIHHCIQVYFDWHAPLVDVWADPEWSVPCAVVTAGLDYLPDPRECEVIWLEEEHGFDLGPDDDPLKFFGFVDMIVKLRRGRNGRWLLLDFKSTYNFDYAKPPYELVEDVQACFYALAAMVEHDLEEIDCRWVYFLTDETKNADARAVDFVITREHAVEVLEVHELRALEAREAMRLDRKLHVIARNGLACGNFGGCVHHPDNGGRCRAPTPSAGALIKAKADQAQLLTNRREYWKRTLGSSTKEARRKRAAPRSSPNRDGERDRDHMAGSNFRERLQQSTGNDGGGETGSGGGDANPDKSKRGGGRKNVAETSNKAPKAPKDRPASTGGGALYLSTEPTEGSVQIPEGAPLHARATKFLEAIFADD